MRLYSVNKILYSKEDRIDSYSTLGPILSSKQILAHIPLGRKKDPLS